MPTAILRVTLTNMIYLDHLCKALDSSDSWTQRRGHSCLGMSSPTMDVLYILQNTGRATGRVLGRTLFPVSNPTKRYTITHIPFAAFGDIMIYTKTSTACCTTCPASGANWALISSLALYLHSHDQRGGVGRGYPWIGRHDAPSFPEKRRAIGRQGAGLGGTIITGSKTSGQNLSHTTLPDSEHPTYNLEPNTTKISSSPFRSHVACPVL
jgi:hypothetical protein